MKLVSPLTADEQPAEAALLVEPVCWKRPVPRVPIDSWPAMNTAGEVKLHVPLPLA